MAIATVASEAKATALLTECRRCLAYGMDLKGTFIKDAIDPLENATVTDTSGRTNVASASFHLQDGRSTAEAAAVDA